MHNIKLVNELDEEKDMKKIFYKERWIKEDGLEQKLIVTFSLKYKSYQSSIDQESAYDIYSYVYKTDFTDALHDTFGFHTDYQILTNKQMKNIFENIKKQKHCSHFYNTQKS